MLLKKSFDLSENKTLLYISLAYVYVALLWQMETKASIRLAD